MVIWGTNIGSGRYIWTRLGVWSGVVCSTGASAGGGGGLVEEGDGIFEALDIVWLGEILEVM